MGTDNNEHRIGRTNAQIEMLAAMIHRTHPDFQRFHGIMSYCKEQQCVNPLLGWSALGPDDLYYHVWDYDKTTANLRTSGWLFEPTVEAGKRFGTYLGATIGVPHAYMWLEQLDDDRREVRTEIPSLAPRPDWITAVPLQHMLDCHDLHNRRPDAVNPLFFNIPLDYLVGPRECYRTEKDYTDKWNRVQDAQNSARVFFDDPLTVSQWLRVVAHVYQTDIDLGLIDSDGRPRVFVEETSNPEHADNAVLVADHIARLSYNAEEQRTRTEILTVDMRPQHTRVRVVSPQHRSKGEYVPRADVPSIIDRWLSEERVRIDNDTLGYRADGSFGVVPDKHAVHIPLSGSGIEVLDIMLDAQHTATPTQIGVGVAMSNY